nr:DUF1043 family protein [Pseudomaricurvus sp. HS19]
MLVGCAIGALAVKGMNPQQQQQSKELEQRLQNTEEKLRNYQQEVTEHFMETSQLVNRLTHSYKEVHEHLASSALKLTNPDISRQLIDAADGKLLSHNTQANDDGDNSIEAPRDWAPREPGAKGQLSEDFDLRQDDSNQDPEPPRS